MKKDTPKSELAALLLKKAENILKINPSSPDLQLTVSEMFQLINNLEVQQDVLEKENKELKLAKTNSENSPEQINHTILDIETLRKSEEKYQTIFDNDRDSITIFRMNDDGKPGSFIEANKATTEIFGYSKKELLSLSLYDLEKVSTKTRNERLKTLKLDGRIDFETNIKTKKGKYRDVEVQVVLINYLDEPAIMNVTRDITERKHLENNINKAYENLATILEAIPDLLFEVGLDGKIYHYQSHSDAFLAVPQEVFMGKLLQEILPADVTNVILEALNEADEKEWSIGKQYSLELPNGKFWFELSVSLINNSTENDKHFIALARNITERKLAEEALKENETFLKQTQHIAKLGSYSLEIQTGKWVSSEVLDSIFGIDSNFDYIIENWASIIHPEWRQIMLDYFTNEVLGKRKDFDKEYKIIRQNNQEERWVCGNGELIFNDKNEPVKMIGTIQDITERKNSEFELFKAKEEADKSREYLDKIINNVGDPVFVKDDQSRILVVNEAFCKIFGMTKWDIIGKTLADDVAKEEWETFLSIDKQVLEDGLENINEELLTVRGGKPFIISTRKTRFIDANGQKFLVGVIHDISKRKENERILQESEKFLKQTQLLAQLGSYTFEIETGKWTSSVVLDSIFGIDSNYEKSSKGWKPIIHPQWREAVTNYFFNEVVGNKSNFDFEFKVIRQNDNTEKWVHGIGELQFNDKNEPIIMIGTVQDITERKEEYEELEKLNRAYSLNGQINDLILRTQNKEILFEEVCKIAVNYGKFRMSWIGILNDANNEVSPITWYGFEESYLNKIKKITIDKVPEGKGPVGSAMRDGKVFVSNDIANDTMMKPWRNEALKRGYHSLISLPIIVRNKTTAVFNLYSDVINFFTNEEEIELLRKITENIAFSLETILVEEERKKAEDSLLKTNSYLENLINYANAPIIVWDPNFKITRFNHTFELLTGRIEAEVIGKPLDFLFPANQIKDSMSKIRKTKSGERWETVEIDILHRDNSVRTVLWNSATIFSPADHTAIATIAHGQDITERKKAEERFRDLVDSTSGIVWEADAETFVFSYVSKQAERLLGYSPKDWYTPGFWAAHIHPDDRKKTVEFCLAQTKQKLDHDFTYRFISKKGQAVWLRDIVNVIVEDGKPKWLRGVMLEISLQKQIEDSLYESEEKYRSLVENSSNAIVIYVEGKIVFANNECVNLIASKNKNQIIGKSILQFVHPDNRAGIIKMLKEIALEGNSLPTTEEKFLRMDGKTIDVEIKAIPTVYERKLAVQLIIQDITERKKSEVKLRQLSQAVEQNPATIVITDPKGNIEYVNPKFHQTTGYTFEEVKGKNPRMLNSGHTKPDEYSDMWNSISDGKDWHGEFYSKRKDGSFYWEYASISPIINEKREITHYIAIKEDITDRKINEYEKQLLTERLTEAQTLAKIGSFETDLNTFNVIWSKETYSIFELDPATFKATHKEFLNFVHPEDREKVELAFTESINKNAFNTLEHRIITTSGTIKFVEDNWHIIYDKQGHPLRSLGTIQDISHSKLTEMELIKAKEQAEESDRLKSAFLANMSHEIRTPMNGILGFTKLLKEPKLSGENQQEYIKIIERSGNRMLNIINDIISISKVESGQMEISQTDTNVNEQVKYLYTFFKNEANQRGVEITYTTTLADKESNIKTDKEKLYAILTNLVKNAIKFTDAGSIAFGYTKKGEFLEFYVKDTGTGISENQKKIIFERFRQAHESISRSFGGSGLGLTISKAYVELLGGKIWVESEEGKGSTFYFTIPFVSTEKVIEEEEIDTIIEKTNAPIRKLKVLIVEDDTISKMLITIAIKKFAGEILNANTGLEAIEACRNNPDIDLVMMDINMPEMGGYEATSRIRKFNRNVVIIAQTANAFASDRDEAIAAGCTDYIPKPVNLASLSELIQKYFKK